MSTIAAERAGKLAIRVAELEKALEGVMVGGNHLVTIIGGDHPPYSATADDALAHYGPGDRYDAWICWRHIMLARDVLERK